jgi:hypothetical protein
MSLGDWINAFAFACFNDMFHFQLTIIMLSSTWALRMKYALEQSKQSHKCALFMVYCLTISALTKSIKDYIL